MPSGRFSRWRGDGNISVITSAPGKMILFGEYAVLEGHEALVLAVDRQVTTHYKPNETLVVDAPGYGRYAPAENHRTLPFISALLDGQPATTGEFRVSSQGFNTHDGKLGLGSSAASTVSFAAALQILKTGQIVKSDLMATAQNAHFQVQGLGSGADIAASCYGGALRYAWLTENETGHVFGQEIKTDLGRACIQPLTGGFPSILAVWTGCSASTTQLVESVRRVRGQEAYASAIKVLSEAAVQGIQGWCSADRATLIDAMTQSTQALHLLGTAASVALVTDTHEQLARLVGTRGAVKPTGAGGGDLAWVLGTNAANDIELAQDMTNAGYECFTLNVCEVGARRLP